MSGQNQSHKLHPKSLVIRNKPKALFEDLPNEVVAEIVRKMDVEGKLKFRTASKRAQHIVDTEQVIEFKRFLKCFPQYFGSFDSFVASGFTPPILHSIIDEAKRMTQLTEASNVYNPLLCHSFKRLVAFYKIYYNQALRHFGWAKFKLLSALTIIDLLESVVKEGFSITNETPNCLKLELSTVYNYNKAELARCAGNIVQFFVKLSFEDEDRYVQEPQQIFAIIRSTPHAIEEFKKCLSKEEWDLNFPDFIEATFLFKGGKTAGDFSFRI